MSGGLADAKAVARKAAFAARKAVHDPVRSDRAAAALLAVLRAHGGRVISGYVPIRTEVSPLSAMAAMAASARIAVPVVQGPGLPLTFREWTPGCAMTEGAFGAPVPVTGADLVPEVLIVPLLAFDARGYRLGYGGGFYDRTLEGLRAKGPVLAIGFAYAAQQVGAVPVDPTDQRLDMIVTEAGVQRL
ncbi:5-formyltetrahydrofolate cyclo-ligase [Actibacterium sp. D379-3]